MITAEKLKLLTTLTPTGLTQFLKSSGYKKDTVTECQFLGLTNGNQFCYKIDYDKEGFEMDLVWEANGPPHELHTGDAGQQSTAKFHIEQPGRMQGMVRRHGVEYQIGRAHV